MEEMKRYFDPNHISKSASTFNQTKLEWLNAHYIKSSSDDELATQLVEFGVDIRSHAKKHLIAQQYKQRAKTLVEMAEGIKILLNRPSCYDEKAYKKFVTESSLSLLAKFSDTLSANLNAKECEEETMGFLDANGAKLKDLAQPLRVAITGGSVSPSIFEICEILGSDEVKTRISNLIKKGL